MKANDMATYTGHSGVHVREGDVVRILDVGTTTVEAYPLKWNVDGVPYDFRHRKAPNGMPYIRLRVSYLTIHKRCMFKEVADNEI